MKYTLKVCSGLFFCLMLAACAQTTPQPTPTAIRVEPTTTIAIAEPTTGPTSSPSPAPSPSASMTLPATAEPTPFALENVPDLSPEEIPAVFQNSLIVKALNAFNGHVIRKVSGWTYGFGDVIWMDADHLLVYPIVGQIGTGDDTSALKGTYPAVISFSTSKVWVPRSNEDRLGGFNDIALLPRWSSQLGEMLAAGADDNSVEIYTADGELKNTYPGRLLGVSPSASKLLMDGNTLIDLKKEKTVAFEWDQLSFATDPLNRPIWSSDENRVYLCCYLYGEASTGKAFSSRTGPFIVDGKEVENFFMQTFSGDWVMNDSYVLMRGGVWEGNPDFVPLFDPAKGTYRNLNAAVGVPYAFENSSDPQCRPNATLGGRYVWMDCFEKDYLLDLTTFKARTYDNLDISDIFWSSDGKFAVMRTDTDLKILSAAKGKFQSAPVDLARVAWHPTQNKLAYFSRNKDQTQILSILDAETTKVQKADLPTFFHDIVWSPDGNHLALVADDNSLWQIDYPTLHNLEQLTPAIDVIVLPETVAPNFGSMYARHVVWSSDGASLTFLLNMDVYKVDLTSKP